MLSLFTAWLLPAKITNKPGSVFRFGYIFFLLLIFCMNACGSESSPNNPVMTAELLVRATPTALSSPTISKLSIPATSTNVPGFFAPVTMVSATAQGSNSALITGTITLSPVVSTPTPRPTEPAPTVTVQAPTQTPHPIAVNSIFYLKGDASETGGRELWVADPKGENKKKLVEGVQSAVPVNDTQILVTRLTGTGDKLQLKFLEIADGVITRQNVLDEQQNGSTRPGISALAVSLDKTAVAYTKINFTAPTFTLFGFEFHPEELWLADLNFSGPAARKLVNNSKDFIEDLHWSTDGNRLAFIHTFHASTGAGYATEIWSVDKDGTHLAYLTGPDEGTYQGENFRAAPATNLLWVGPTELSFQSYDQVHFPLWIHDLTLGKDQARPLSLNADSRSYHYCEAVRRYAFIKRGPKYDSPYEGLFTVSVDEPGEGPAPGQLFDGGAKAVFDCKGDNLLYLDGKGQIIMAKLNKDGSVGTKVKIGNYQYSLAADSFAANYGSASIAPDGGAVLVLPPTTNSDKTLTIFRLDGSNISLQDANFPLAGETADWYDAKRLVLSSPKQGGYLFVLVNISTSPGTITLLDSALQKVVLITQN